MNADQEMGNSPLTKETEKRFNKVASFFTAAIIGGIGSAAVSISQLISPKEKEPVEPDMVLFILDNLILILMGLLIVVMFTGGLLGLIGLFRFTSEERKQFIPYLNNKLLGQ